MENLRITANLDDLEKNVSNSAQCSVGFVTIV